MARKRVEIVSLGCSKNLVDSERLLAMLREAGLDAAVADTVSGSSRCGGDQYLRLYR